MYEKCRTYEGILPVYESVIPISIKAAESSAVGISVYTHANNCKVCAASGSSVR